ncbi:MAG: phage integrase N-terminal SAM-like domain-containing protein [Sphingomonadales bacterium]|jgi:hypothetical protein
MTDTTTSVSPLRRRMIDDMMLRNLSPATQRSYLHVVTKFGRYFGRSPDRLGLEHVRAFQVYLVVREERLKPWGYMGFGAFEVIGFARFGAQLGKKLVILRACARRGFSRKSGRDSVR